MFTNVLLKKDYFLWFVGRAQKSSVSFPEEFPQSLLLQNAHLNREKANIKIVLSEIGLLWGCRVRYKSNNSLNMCKLDFLADLWSDTRPGVTLLLGFVCKELKLMKHLFVIP